MRSMSIGMEPIAVTSAYPTPQTVTEGDFAQSLQDTVDMGAAPFPQSQQPVQNTPQQPLSEYTEMAEQSDIVTEMPVQTSEAAELDPELMKELADLLGKNEEMLTAPQRMRKTLENMMVQALSELSDPEEQEEEFTEMVLDFLMEFIDRKFGGETEETSVFTEKSEKDEDDNVKDVLLQAVVQMLDNIRSENDEDDRTEVPEDEEQVEAIPSTRMDKSAVVAVSPLLSEETKQMVELDSVSFTEAPQTSAEPKQETYPQARHTEELPQVQTAEADDQLYQAARQTAESIFTAVTQPQQPAHFRQVQEPQQPRQIELPEQKLQPDQRPQPSEQTQPIEPKEQLKQGEMTEHPQRIPQSRQIWHPQQAEQPQQVQQPDHIEQAEQVWRFPQAEQAQQLPQAQQAEQLRQFPQVQQPVKTEKSREPRPLTAAQSLVEPKDELEELTRLVRGGETVKAEQPELNLNLGSEQPTADQIKPASKLEATGETIPFEAAIASTVPQITLTRAIENGENGAERIVTQIASELFNHLPESGGTTTFVMTLNPETLGKVTVKVVEEAGKISVSVTAHEKRTAEILSQRFDTLQTAMKENGTQLEKYQVVYAPEKDEGAGHQNFDGSSRNPYVKQEEEEGEDNGEFAEILQQAV